MQAITPEDILIFSGPETSLTFDQARQAGSLPVIRTVIFIRLPMPAATRTQPLVAHRAARTCARVAIRPAFDSGAFTALAGATDRIIALSYGPLSITDLASLSTTAHAADRAYCHDAFFVRDPDRPTLQTRTDLHLRPAGSSHIADMLRMPIGD